MSHEHDFGLEWIAKHDQADGAEHYFLVNKETKRIFGIVSPWKGGFYKVEPLAFDLKPAFWVDINTAKSHFFNDIRDKLRSGL